MEAVYSTRRYPACFNFAEFLVAAKTYGATGILFDDINGYAKKYSPQETRTRMETIVEPLCALADIPFRYGTPDGSEINPGYHISAVIGAYKEYGWIAKLKSVKPPAKARYTVSLRNADRNTQRNTNNKGWREFAASIGATVIEDWADDHMHLHDRMALYAGAEMNFIPNGGTSALCLFSDYPYIHFKKKPAMSYLIAHGWVIFGSVPWANENQKTVWADDTDENIALYCGHYVEKRSIAA